MFTLSDKIPEENKIQNKVPSNQELKVQLP